MSSRVQFVVGLGDGPEGQRLKEVLEHAAARTGKPLSVWARERLLDAAGDPKSEAAQDPVIEVQYQDEEGRQPVMLLDLRAVYAMRGGHAVFVQALIGGTWWTLVSQQPNDLIERWKRARSWVA